MLLLLHDWRRSALSIVSPLFVLSNFVINHCTCTILGQNVEERKGYSNQERSQMSKDKRSLHFADKQVVSSRSHQSQSCETSIAPQPNDNQHSRNHSSKYWRSKRVGKQNQIPKATKQQPKQSSSQQINQIKRITPKSPKHQRRSVNANLEDLFSIRSVF